VALIHCGFRASFAFTYSKDCELQNFEYAVLFLDPKVLNTTSDALLGKKQFSFPKKSTENFRNFKPENEALKS
jgi:hypothetical protein